MIKKLISSLLTPLFEKTYLENFRKIQFFLQIPAWPRGSEIHCHTNSSRWSGVKPQFHSIFLTLTFHFGGKEIGAFPSKNRELFSSSESRRGETLEGSQRELQAQAHVVLSEQVSRASFTEQGGSMEKVPFTHTCILADLGFQCSFYKRVGRFGGRHLVFELLIVWLRVYYRITPGGRIRR